MYFITASDALQAASAMAPQGSDLGTSRFTEEIIEGLRNGRTKDGGWITPDALLFDYLTAQMTRDGVPEEQRPTKSTIRATRSLPFARSVARPVRLPVLPHDATGAARRSPALLKAREAAEAGQSEGSGPAWPAWATGRPVPPELLESPAEVVSVEREVRVPAWRILSGGTAPAPLFD
ncbi:hypothetical protein [Streptomyces prasinopilosus]|uniref:Uncharacterized protein n=1 Tax=Streptomyces prasinopilosus TaxID=67344 RepID=A0A1G6LAZ4_9ACTN|nr:hypothetical protein [Streptomyces prasinopilosus]SDC39756.1 hypothetical protein SAMN05216505_10210 [Streptomyces prasinopilosus]